MVQVRMMGRAGDTLKELMALPSLTSAERNDCASRLRQVSSSSQKGDR